MKKLSVFLVLFFLSLSYLSLFHEMNFSLADLLFKTTQLDQTSLFILKNIRAPRVMTAILVGSNLAVSGLVFQSLLQNPMVDSYILGSSSGAAFFISLTPYIITLFPLLESYPFFSETSLALIGALVCPLIVLGVGNRFPQYSRKIAILLSGIILGFFTSSLVGFSLSIQNPNNYSIILKWLLGSLSLAKIELLPFFSILSLLITLCIFIYSKYLDVLVFGYDFSKTTGINPNRTIPIFFILGSILVAVSVSNSGTIGFIGLIIPQMLRITIGSKHKALIPLSLICGASFLVLSDFISRNLIENNEIPIGVITSLIGSPLFLSLFLFKFNLLGKKND